MTASEKVDLIAEFVRRTVAAQGLPVELDDVSVARRVATLIIDEARNAPVAEEVA